MRRVFKYAAVIFSIGIFSLALAQYSFSLSGEKPEGEYVRIADNAVLHCPHSKAVCRHFWSKAIKEQNDSLIRIAVISIGTGNDPLKDSLVNCLRDLLNDPRVACSWKWSRNWTPPAHNRNYLFSRPSVPVNNCLHSPHHDYIDAWVECTRTDSLRPLRLTFLYRNFHAGISATYLSGDSISETAVPDDYAWRLMNWNFSGPKAMLTVSGEESPEIGAIAAEPEKGFSIWSLRLPEKCSASQLEDLGRQASLIRPGILFITGSPDKISNGILRCRKIFHGIPFIACTDNGDSKLLSAVFSAGAACYFSGARQKISAAEQMKTVLRNEILSCRKIP